MKRLLIVDDEPDLLDALTLALESQFQVETAANGRDALARLAAEPFDLLVLDLMMPVMSGEELLGALHAQGHRQPVVVISAGRNLDETCARIGVAHFVQKPYPLAQLLAKIDAALFADGSSDPP